MPHGSHIYVKASDMANATMCTYPHSDHALPHWQCILQYCSDCLFISLIDQEIDNNMEKKTPSIQFHIYHIIGRCTDHGRISL